MTPTFYRFPHTPHLAWSGPVQPRGDKVYSREDRDKFLDGDLVVEEKVEGANLGLSVGPGGRVRVQNRGAYLGPGAHLQFESLWGWLAARDSRLARALGNRFILFGEWCFAVHSIRYDRLPGWFLGFDVYDRRSDQFWSTERRDELLSGLAIPAVPVIARGRFTLDALLALLDEADSQLRSGLVEGLYIRREQDDCLLDRAKLLRPDFLEGIEQHWSRQVFETNALALEAAGGDSE